VVSMHYNDLSHQTKFLIVLGVAVKVFFNVNDFTIITFIGKFFLRALLHDDLLHDD